MSFNMSNATNARSTSGIKKLISNYQKDINKVASAIQGEKYTELTNTIRKYWQGADCDKYLQSLNRAVCDVRSQITSFSSQISSALEQENSDFRKFQSNNNV